MSLSGLAFPLRQTNDFAKRGSCRSCPENVELNRHCKLSKLGISFICFFFMLSSMVTLSLYFIELMHCFSYIFIETSIQYPDITDKHEYSPASVSKHLN